MANVDEGFWADLLPFLDDGEVIAVVGQELLTADPGDGRAPVSLYRLVAEELLNHYGVTFARELSTGQTAPSGLDEPVVLRRGYELNDAVCALSKADKIKRFQDVYRPVFEIIAETSKKYQDVVAPILEKLAGITPLRLFISATSDNLLAQALNRKRYGGRPLTQEIKYAPALPDRERSDLLELEDSIQERSAVFYLFGKASAGTTYCIHEEDMLEFIYKLHDGPRRMLDEVRSNKLLFIGCPLSDWMGRFLLRTSIGNRLREDRDKHEFMVISPETTDPELTTFLVHFSHDTRLCSAQPAPFIDDLVRRWEQYHSCHSNEPAPETEPPFPSGPIFISYANEDHESALRLYQHLEKIAQGRQIAWLDKKPGGLRWGDNWETRIQQVIDQECQLFIPLISAVTQKRKKGVFRKEWEWAARRDEGTSENVKFILPLFIDAETASLPADELDVHRRFKTKHFERAFGGEISDDLLKLLQEAIRNMQ